MSNFKSSIWFGIILGLCVPIVGSALVMMVFEQLSAMDIMKTLNGVFSAGQTRTIYVLGIIFNLIPFQYFKVKKLEKPLNGVVLMTIILVFVWLIYFYKTLF
ncbi:MAG: hypothetical protein R2771_07090 [Saprospiraceae bacterium]